MTAPELYKVVNGEPMIGVPGMALLLGVDVDTFRAEVDRQGGAAKFLIPTDWVRQGRRIGRETAAAIGSDSMRDVLDYLAAKS